MREQRHHTGPDAEETLVSPRFDQTEAQRARPVVPLRAARRREPTTKGANWGDLISRRAKGANARRVGASFPSARRAGVSLSRAFKSLTAGASRPALLVVPFLLAALVAGLAVAARRDDAPRTAETSAPAHAISGSLETSEQGEAAEQLMVVPVVRPKDAAPRNSRRQARQRGLPEEATLVGMFVVPPEAFADDEREKEEEGKGKKRRGKRQKYFEGQEELDRFAERLGGGREARRLKEFLKEMEQ